MSRKQPFPLEEFRSIYSRVPRLTVDLVIKTDEGILFTLRQANGWEGLWHLPGGTIYLGESVVQAIDRVAMEELGIRVQVQKLLGYIEYPSDVHERGYGYTIGLSFLCRPLDNNIQLDDQANEYQYFRDVPNNTIVEQKEFLSKL